MEAIVCVQLNMGNIIFAKKISRGINATKIMLLMLIIIQTIASMNYFTSSRKNLTSLVEITIMPMKMQVIAKSTTVCKLHDYSWFFSMDN